MGIFKKDFKAGDEIVYKLKKDDNIPKGKKEGDKIKGKIKNIKGDKVDIEWENGEEDNDIDIKKINEELDIIKKYMSNKKKGIYEFLEYKIKKDIINNKEILTGYSNDYKYLFRIVEDRKASDIGYDKIFKHFYYFLELKKFELNEEVTKKYNIENISKVLVEDKNEFKDLYYKYGIGNEYKDTYQVGDVIINFFISVNEIGDQINYYTIDKKVEEIVD